MDSLLNLKVITNQADFRLKGFDALTKTLKISVTSLPEKGKANTEIEKELTKLFNKNTRIIRGLKSDKKIVSINNLSLKEIQETILKNL